MLGLNCARVYGFEVERLQAVADAINSLTFAELAVPFEGQPESVTTRAARFCFRRRGPVD